MSRSIVQVITVVFIDDIPYLHEKPFIWIETEKFHFGFSCVILTEIQISQSTALICCISDVTYSLHTCVHLAEMQTVSSMISTQLFIGAAPHSCVNPRHSLVEI